MEKLKASDDTRITYDEATGAVRSFFGVNLVEPPDASPSRAGRSAGDTTRAFLDANKDAFKLEAVTLARAGERKGSASTAVTYVQEHHGIPVYGGKVVVGVEQTTNRVASVVNHVDYEVPANLTREAVRVSAEQVPGIVRTHLAQLFAHVKTGQPALYIYRCEAVAPPDTESRATREKVKLAEALGGGEVGRAYPGVVDAGRYDTAFRKLGCLRGCAVRRSDPGQGSAPLRIRERTRVLSRSDHELRQCVLVVHDGGPGARSRAARSGHREPGSAKRRHVQLERPVGRDARYRVA